MRTRTPFVVSICVGLAIPLLSASTAWAQFGRASRITNETATGEAYNVEFFGGLWNPTPEITVSSEQLGIPGTDIDAVADLGILRKRFREFRIALRPARKHKFRIQFVPIFYEGNTVLERSIVFNGIRYNLGVPIQATARWNTWRFGYEYDFIYRDRWFIGFIAEGKYTDIDVTLDSPLVSEFARARAPVPAIGGIGRAYLARNVAITFELTGFKLPEGIDENYRAQYLDLDIYGTLNFTNNVGFQVGYRSVDALYRVNKDAGDLKLKGAYFGGLVRF